MKCLDCVLTYNYLMNCFTLAYPVCCLVVLYVALLFRDDHQFIDGNRCARSSRSTGERWLRCL